MRHIKTPVTLPPEKAEKLYIAADAIQELAELVDTGEVVKAESLLRILVEQFSRLYRTWALNSRTEPRGAPEKEKGPNGSDPSEPFARIPTSLTLRQPFRNGEWETLAEIKSGCLGVVPMKPSNEVLMNDSSLSDAFFEPFEKAASEVLLGLRGELTDKEMEENTAVHRIGAFISELQAIKLQFQKGLINRTQAIRLISQATRQWAAFDVPENPSPGQTQAL